SSDLSPVLGYTRLASRRKVLSNIARAHQPARYTHHTSANGVHTSGVRATGSRCARRKPSFMSIDTVTSNYTSTHKKLQSWVDDVAALTKPDRIHWVDGSDAEWDQSTGEIVEAGTLVQREQEKKP